ncbi:hypothetical protein BGZ73_006848 [Actinomortierella ambigua]|nr:hypothetical protein BGZ73_006848 [Actinomortierella ambigua]
MAKAPMSRVSGKEWKESKTATNRTYLQKGVKSSFEKRMAKSRELKLARDMAKEMTEEKIAEKRRKREITEERRKIKEEKERLEAMAAKMSVNKLKRLKKKQGNLKGR